MKKYNPDTCKACKSEFKIKVSGFCLECEKKMQRGKPVQMINYDYQKEDYGISFSLILDVEDFGDAYSDEICIDKDTNSLWVSYIFNINEIEDCELSDWFRYNFSKPDAVKGYIRRIFINEVLS